MTDRYRITFDSAIENAFNVHTEEGIVKFERTPGNLYKYSPKYRTNTSTKDIRQTGVDEPHPDMQLLDTVQDNAQFYTPRQVCKAKKARTLLHALGCPSIKDLRAIITSNAIKNYDVTLDDINMAETIFGPDVASIKGKTTRKKVKPVVHNLVKVPTELLNTHKNVELCMDTIKVNGLPFLLTISIRQWILLNMISILKWYMLRLKRMSRKLNAITELLRKEFVLPFMHHHSPVSQL